MDATNQKGPVVLHAPLHVAILVSNLARSREFYEGVLGLQPVERALKFPGIWYQIGDFQVHLMVNPEWQMACPRPDKWGRNPHVAFAIADLTAAQAALTAAGFPLQMSASGRAALFTQDPDGNIIELTQVSP